MPVSEKFWFAIYTRPRWEKKIAGLLEQKGIEFYCPLRKVPRQWKDRKKTILEPVFKTYIFVKVSNEKKWELKQINGIVNFVYWLGKPAKIREDEIINVRKFLNEFEDVSVENLEVQENTNVKIRQGVLMNYRGIVVEIKGNRAKIRINSMGMQLSAYFDKKNIEPVFENKTT